MEYSNPFDDQQGQFYILENTCHQYSLWPAQCTLPGGWSVVYGPEGQASCQDWLASQWRDLTPSTWASDAMGAAQ